MMATLEGPPQHEPPSRTCGGVGGFWTMRLSSSSVSTRPTPCRPHQPPVFWIVSFRERLLATLHAVRPVLDEPGIMVAGSQVPNLLEPDARSSLVVSQAVDICVPVERHEAVRQRLANVKGHSRAASCRFAR
jgi:hypothetical protein